MYLIYRVAQGKRINVAHRETFTLGFLWYAGLPLALSTVHLPVDVTELKYWRAIATLMGPEKLAEVTLWGFFIWLSFILGCHIAYKPAEKSLAVATTLPSFNVSGWRLTLIIVGIAALLFGVAWGIAYRGLLFRGYADSYDDVARGPLQGALLYTSVVATIAFLSRETLGRIPFLILATAVLGLTVLSLSVGTRSMPALVTVMFIAVASRLRGGLPRLPLIIGAAAMLVVLSGLAAWRLRSSSIGLAVLSPALEPLFTYISAATYLTFNNVSTIAFPTPLLGGLANLVPRVIWPAKVEFIDGLTDGVRIFAPLGAIHLFVSLLLNFGWIGSILATFAAGMGAERLSRSLRPVAITSYGVVTAVVMADIWRNPLSQSLIKNVLQGAVILPAILAVMAMALQVRRAKIKRHIKA